MSIGTVHQGVKRMQVLVMLLDAELQELEQADMGVPAQMAISTCLDSLNKAVRCVHNARAVLKPYLADSAA